MLLKAMSKNLLPLVLIIICLVIQGCGPSIKFVQTGNVYPPFEDPVKIFRTPPKDLKYEELGWVTSEGFQTKWGTLLELTIKKAASKGANAVIIEVTDSGYGYYRRDTRTIVGKAIRILESIWTNKKRSLNLAQFGVPGGLSGQQALSYLKSFQVLGSDGGSM